MIKLQQRDVKYSTDLSSHQIWDVMNYIIAQAASPYLLYADLSIETAFSCLSISTDNRRKIGAQVSTAMLDTVFNDILNFEDTEDSRVGLFTRLQQAGIERHIFTDHIEHAHNTAALPAQLSIRKVRDHIRLWLGYYETFRRDVVDRYFYLIQSFSRTNQYIKSRNGLETTREDMLNVYVISAMHALDKFIPYEGTLTTYIQTWFQNAEGSSNFVVYDGEAFDLNRSTRKDVQSGTKAINNKGIDIADRENTLSVGFEAEYSDSFDRYVHIVSKFDNAPILFMAQNLPFVLNKEQLARIEAHNRTVVKDQEQTKGA